MEKNRAMVAALVLACAASAPSQSRAVDTGKSVLRVHVYKEGMLSAFGHDHDISAPIAAGTVDLEGRKVELQVNAGALRVEDAKASEKDRAEVQATMLGAEVLDAEKHKEIRFRSTSAEPAGPGVWKVSGDLTLHGQSRPVSFDVHEKDGRYSGACRLKLTDFGIKPVKAAGGTVKVKNEVEIDFDIQLAR